MAMYNLLLIVFIGVTVGLYVDNGKPYDAGILDVVNTTLTTEDQKLPVHTTAFHPSKPGSYAVVYFIPGAPSGFIPGLWYSDVVTRIAEHGFIVLVADAFWPVIKEVPVVDETAATDLITKHINNVLWLQSNLSKYINQTAENVSVSWLHSSLLCHSAGCDVTLRMLWKNNTLVNATVFLEPNSVNIQKNFSSVIPAYMYGTQFAEEFGPFPCNIPGEDYVEYYKQWNHSKWITEVADFGHCDILDNFPWESCHIGHFCKTVGDWSRVYPAYHEFVQGAVSSFLITHLQGRTDAIKYIEEATLIPQKMLKLNHTIIN